MFEYRKNEVGPDEALERLRAGNARFVEGIRASGEVPTPALRRTLAQGQAPFAVVLGCADSRVPAELVFDSGLGDLFVVRVAGNVVAPSLLGSVEFAVSKLGTRLVVVMGHTRCGAVEATIDAIRDRTKGLTDNIDDICDRIEPAIRELVEAGLPDEQLLSAAVRANVRASASHLRHGSRLLEERVRAGELRIIAAEYALETGRVTFLDESRSSAAG